MSAFGPFYLVLLSSAAENADKILNVVSAQNTRIKFYAPHNRYEAPLTQHQKLYIFFIWILAYQCERRRPIIWLMHFWFHQLVSVFLPYIFFGRIKMYAHKGLPRTEYWVSHSYLAISNSIRRRRNSSSLMEMITFFAPHSIEMDFLRIAFE